MKRKLGTDKGEGGGGAGGCGGVLSSAGGGGGRAVHGISASS